MARHQPGSGLTHPRLQAVHPFRIHTHNHSHTAASPYPHHHRHWPLDALDTAWLRTARLTVLLPPAWLPHRTAPCLCIALAPLRPEWPALSPTFTLSPHASPPEIAALDERLLLTFPPRSQFNVTSWTLPTTHMPFQAISESRKGHANCPPISPLRSMTGDPSTS